MEIKGTRNGKLLAFLLGMMVVAGVISVVGLLVLIIPLLMKVPSFVSWSALFMLASWSALFMLASAIVGGLIYRHW